MLFQSAFAAACLLSLATALPTATIEERDASPADTTQADLGATPHPEPAYDYPAKHFCNNFPLANAEDAIDAITQFKDDVTSMESPQICVGAGPAACSVVAASGDANVAFCNDNPYPKCCGRGDLYYRAMELYNACRPKNYQNPGPWSGQVLFGDNTNLLVKAK